MRNQQVSVDTINNSLPSFLTLLFRLRRHAELHQPDPQISGCGPGKRSVSVPLGPSRERLFISAQHHHQHNCGGNSESGESTRRPLVSFLRDTCCFDHLSNMYPSQDAISQTVTMLIWQSLVGFQ